MREREKRKDKGEKKQRKDDNKRTNDKLTLTC